VGNSQTIVKYRDTPRSSVQTQLNRSIGRFGWGLQWAEGCTNSIIFTRLRQCAPHGRTRCCHLSNNSELNHSSIRRRCALYQITLTTCHLWTRRLRKCHIRAEYCIVGISHNTAI